MLEKIRIFYFLLLMKPYHHHNHIHFNYTSGFRECKYILNSMFIIYKCKIYKKKNEIKILRFIQKIIEMML